MANKFTVKAISFAVAIAISSTSFALPTGEDFPRKMPLTAYIAKSMASDEDLEKMASKYFNSTGIQNPFSVVKDQLGKAFYEQQLGRLSSGDSIGYLANSDQSVVASRINRYKMLAADNVDAAKLERILGTTPPMDMWLPSYITRFFAATYVGGRVMPTWPKNAMPLFGSLTGTNERGEPYWYLNSESATYDEYKDRKESRFFGGNRYASFPRLPSSVLDGDIEHARVFMQNTIIALLYTQILSVDFVGDQISKHGIEATLFKPLDRQEALFSIGMGYSKHYIPENSTYKSEWAHTVISNSLSSDDPNLILQFKFGAAAIEKIAADLIYIPLSKAGEPIKFVFKPVNKGRTRWALVEFTNKGLEVRTLQDAEREFPIIKKLGFLNLPNNFMCREDFGNRCFDFFFGNFDSELVVGGRRFVMIPEKLRTKTEQLVDALEEASKQLPAPGVQTKSIEEIQLPKPGEKIDFWELSNPSK